MDKVLSSLRSTYRLASVAIDLGQIPNDMRRSLELVRTCHQDLQHLIDLRNEHLPLLESQPQALQRVNTIIEAAHKGLAEVYQIVEKCRPELHHGKTPLQNQMAWIFRDSQEFRSLGPVISRNHAAVLAEISFLRTLALVTMPGDRGKGERSIGSNDTDTFDNMALLEDLMGDISVQVSPDLTPTSSAATKVSVPNLLASYCDLPEPVIPNAIPDQQPISKPQAHAPSSSTPWAPNAQASKQDSQRDQRVVLNQADHSGLSLLLGDEVDLNPSLSFRLQSQSIRSPSSDSMHRPSMSSFSIPSISSLRGSISSLTVPSVGDTPIRSSQGRHSLISRLSTLSPLRSQKGFDQPRFAMPSAQTTTENPPTSDHAPFLTTQISSGVQLLSTIPSDWIYNYDEVAQPITSVPSQNTQWSKDHRHSLPPTKPLLPEEQQLPARSVTFDSLQKLPLNQQPMPFSQRYACIGEDPHTKLQSYHPWRPVTKDHHSNERTIFELQGSPVPNRRPVSHKSTTPLPSFQQPQLSATSTEPYTLRPP